MKPFEMNKLLHVKMELSLLSKVKTDRLDTQLLVAKESSYLFLKKAIVAVL